MARKKKYRAQVESIHEEEEPHDTSWGGTNWGTSGWDQGDQGGWDEDGRDQDQNINAWQNAPVRDNDVQPGDSISNASYEDTVIDREAPAGPAPTPPAKDVPMLAGANGWGWAGAVNEPAVKSAMRGQNRNTAVYGSPTALGMQGMLSAIAEQRQAQHMELTEQIRQAHQRAEDLTYGAHQKGGLGRGKGRHARESTNLGGGWGQASEVGTSHSNRPPAGETNWGGGWGGAWGNDQAGQGNDWAGTAEGTNTATKSKKKRSKNRDQQSNMQANTGEKDDGLGSSWGAGGGWDGLPASTSVAPGGFGATSGTDAAANGWGTNKGDAYAAPLTQSQSWGAWTETQADHGDEKGKESKSGISGFFSRIFGGKDRKKKEKTKGKGKGKEKERGKVEIVWAEDTKVEETEKGKRKGKEKSIKGIEQGKKGKVLKKQKFAEPEAMTWANPKDDAEDEDEDYDEEGETIWANDRRETEGWNDTGKGWGNAQAAPRRTSRASEGWSNASHGKTSKAYAMATDGYDWGTGQAQKDAHVAEHRIVESHGDAFVSARAALFSKERLTRDRIFWAFDPHQDPRVASVLSWIQYMQTSLATFGFSKFLESKERGALFTNVEYRSPSAPQEPAFDWLTFDHVQPTTDKILQESVACYDPASQIIVFVFLLSESKRSMAIWRRKIPLPDNIRHTYGTHLTKLIAGLDKKYPIHVDELSADAYYICTK
ncbi:hypothetical protein ACEPAI_5909 [Sanghuangporus weigelae]